MGDQFDTAIIALREAGFRIEGNDLIYIDGSKEYRIGSFHEARGEKFFTSCYSCHSRGNRRNVKLLELIKKAKEILIGIGFPIGFQNT